MHRAYIFIIEHFHRNCKVFCKTFPEISHFAEGAAGGGSFGQGKSPAFAGVQLVDKV